MIAATVGYLFIRGPENAKQLLYPAVSVLALFMGWLGVRAIATPTQKNVQTAVKNFVLCIVFFDAILAGIGGGLTAAVIVLLLIVPARFFARRHAVT